MLLMGADPMTERAPTQEPCNDLGEYDLTGSNDMADSYAADEVETDGIRFPC
jgi:hypothetical protein